MIVAKNTEMLVESRAGIVRDSVQDDSASVITNREITCRV